MPRKTKNGQKSGPKLKKKKNRTNGGSVGAMVGSSLGAKFGPLGSKLGGAIGNLAGGALSRLFGKGDYGIEIERNSIMSPRHADAVPLFGTEDGAIRVRHREFISDLQGSTAFRNLPIVISPSNGLLMPWLSSFAQSFEQYRLMGMVIEFKSTSGAFGITSPALGSVMIATQYNTRVHPFGDKVSMLNHFFGTSCKAAENLLHPIECKDAYDPLKVYYVRNGQEDDTLSFDPRMEDYAVVNVATQGQPGAYTVGELWCTYDVMLYKPRIRSGTSVLAIDPLPVADPVTLSYQHVPEWPRRCCTPPLPEEEKELESMPMVAPVLTRQSAVVFAKEAVSGAQVLTSL